MSLDKQHTFTAIEISVKQGDLYITLNRPQVKNALNRTMVDELMAVITEIDKIMDYRMLVIRGKGGVFCAGGDINDMRNLGKAENHEVLRKQAVELNATFGNLLARLEQVPVPVVVIAEGAVLGGGVGLVCVADIVLSDENTVYGLTEVRLGLPPAQIIPYLLRRLGLSQARRLSLSGMKINGVDAQSLGLVHELFSTETDLEEKLKSIQNNFHHCAPEALAITKRMLRHTAGLLPDNFAQDAAGIWTDALISNEGQEGTRAFLEKRKPAWADR